MLDSLESALTSKQPFHLGVSSFGPVPSETVKIGKISTTHQILGSGDFNGDGNIDILIQDTTTGGITVWYMDGTTYVGSDRLATVPASLHVCGAGDFNGDGKPDIILQDTVTGERKIWLMDGKNHDSTVTVGTLPVEWQIVD